MVGGVQNIIQEWEPGRGIRYDIGLGGVQHKIQYNSPRWFIATKLLFQVNQHIYDVRLSDTLEEEKNMEGERNRDRKRKNRKRERKIEGDREKI